MASHSTPDRFRCQQRVIFFNRVVKPVKKSSILSSMPISVCLQISWPLINWAEFLLRSRFTILSVRRSELGFRPWNAAWLFSSLQSQRRVGIQCSFKSYYSADKHFRPFSEGSEKCWKRPTSSAKKKRKLPPSHRLKNSNNHSSLNYHFQSSFLSLCLKKSVFKLRAAPLFNALWGELIFLSRVLSNMNKNIFNVSGKIYEALKICTKTKIDTQ